MVNKNSKYYKNGINKNTYDMLFPDFYNIKKEKIADEKTSLIIELIDVYTFCLLYTSDAADD